MDYGDVFDAFFDPRKCSSIFYSTNLTDCPMVQFLEDRGSHDYSEEELDILSVRIFGGGKHPVLIVQYEIPMPEDLDPTEAMECIMKNSELIDFRFWFFMLSQEVLEHFLDNFSAHYRDRSAIKYHKDEEDRSAHFFEVRKGELLTSIYYTMAPLANGFHLSP
ncbi:MAG: hypothetical protein P1P90_03965 [Patescibacteria group bacterium]|nr:hypothetical protein [Patescibacteria group bacterium]